MKAMIFAAGLGTRLRPFTNDRPKALVQLQGKPLLEWAILKLSSQGVTEIVINVHHFGEQIIEFIQNHDQLPVPIHISDERDLLLNTGGGLKKALPLLGDQPFIVYNTDILTDLNLRELHQEHLRKNGLATLAVRKRTTSRYLLFNSSMQLSGWRNVKSEVTRISRKSEDYADFGFSGIHIIDPAIIQFMPEHTVFSIIDVYLEAARTELIFGHDHSSSFWMDVGRVDDLKKAESLPLI